MSALQVLSEDALLVSWRVENVGAAPPNSAVWSDAIYLSTNAVLDTNAVLLGVSQNPASLAPGAFYTNALEVTLPAEIQGDFFVHVVADAAAEVIEDNRANNVLAATNTLQVTLRPVPDLAVVSVATPADGFSGQLFELSWTVTNRGPASGGRHMVRLGLSLAGHRSSSRSSTPTSATPNALPRSPTARATPRPRCWKSRPTCPACSTSSWSATRPIA